MWFDKLKMTKYERMLDRAEGLSRNVRSLFAGTARAVRLSEPDESNEVVRRVAAGIVAPLAVCYVWWVLKDAQARGITRLYFLARDGHILHEVAKVLVERWGLEMEVRYLFVSRESLLQSSLREISDFERYWVTWGYLSTITLNEIFQRLGMQKEEQAEFYKVEKAFSTSGAPLGRDDQARVLEALAHPQVMAAIQKRNRQRFDATAGYLRQEGLFDEVRYAVVDTGWKGTSQYALSAILNRVDLNSGVDLRGYYLGLNEDVFIYRENQLCSFLFDWTRTPRDSRLFNFLCFEMLLATKHGRTTHYREVGGRYEPVRQIESISDFDWLLDIHHEAARQYAAHVGRLLSLDEFPAGAARACCRLLRRFISAPDEQEAALYGDYLIASEIREGDMQRMAPEISFGEFLEIVAGRSRIRGYWPQASFVRAGLKLVNFGYGLFLDLKLLDIYRKHFLKY